MARSFISRGLVLLLITASAYALRITPDSSCSSVCGDTTTTNASNVVCNDFDYYRSSEGSTFMSCMECLQTSNATRDADNDVSWFLYNLRYASAVCLYDYPSQNTSADATSVCNVDHACKPLQGALVSGNLNPLNETQYGYCQADDDAFYGTSIDNCVSCLQSSPSTYTANFLLALEAGCKQEPAPGALLSITGSLFSTLAINITMPSNSTASSYSSTSPPLSTTTIIAIAVSLTALFATAAALFTIYFLRQRRYAREDAHLDLIHNSHHPHHPGNAYLYYGKGSSGGGLGSSLSAHTASSYALRPAAPPNYTVDYKAPSQDHVPAANSTAAEYDSNAEYYDRLEGLSRGRPLGAHPVRLTAPLPTGPSPAVEAALPTHPAYIPRSVTPGALGGRPSRSASISGSNRSDQLLQRASESSSNRATAATAGRKPTSYAMEMFLDGRGDEPFARASSQNLEMQLGGVGSHDNNSNNNDSNNTKRQQRISPPPPVALSQRRRISLSPPPPAPPERAITGTPGISDLLLPPMPKLRFPLGKNKAPPGQRTDESVPLDVNMGISGPLAFPDSRFTVRPDHAGDRIVEQTVVDRGRRGNTIEVPIGSGKSYLYG
ncbi:unnamed protein product [Discula destructiva]